MKFSDLYIKNLKPKKDKFYKREANGFAIRVMPTGVKTWLFVYTYEGKRKELNLGQYPHVGLSDARTKYNNAFELLKQGNDPGTLEREAKEEKLRLPTVADVAAEYMEKWARPNKKSWREDLRCLNKDVLPYWGKRKAVDIKKRDVILLLEGIVERGSPVQSNNVFEVIRKMFNFAVERDILEYSPCMKVKALTPKKPRDRHLDENEIKTLWENLAVAGMTEELRRALKLILVTAQRPGEVIGIHTSEINGRWWTIPPERSKNGLAHRVYLTDLALGLIGSKTGYVFESPRLGKPIDVNALANAVRNNCPNKPELEETMTNKLGIDFFRPHDLRRTAATQLSKLRFTDEVIDAVLNHVKKGVIRIYNLYKYDKEKKQAMEAWSRKLQKTVM